MTETAKQTISRLLIIAGAGLIALLAAMADLPETQAIVAGLSVFAIGYWALGVLPEYVTGLLFLTGAMLFAVAPEQVVFSGFYSKAFWLVFGGLIIGIALKRSGLGERVAEAITNRFQGSYASIVTGVTLMGLAMAFAMPSTMGRVLLMLPITLAIADRLGFADGSKGRTGLVLAAGAATYLPAVGILPATVPVMVLVGAAETQHSVVFSYGDWFLLHFPVLGFLKLPLIVWVTTVMFKDAPTGEAIQPESLTLGRDAKLLSLLLVSALILWATDSLHGISPAWVSLAVGVACLLPGLALVPPKVFTEKFQIGPLVFVGAILGLGAVVNHSGLGDVIAQNLLRLMPLQVGADFQNYLSFTGLNSVVGLMTGFPGMAAVMTPLAGALATASGWSVEMVLHTQVIGFSGLILAYQTPPMLVAASLGGVAMTTTTRYLLVLWGISTLVLVPLNYLWWQALGRL